MGKAPETFVAIESVIKAFAVESQNIDALEDVSDKRDGTRGEGLCTFGKDNFGGAKQGRKSNFFFNSSQLKANKETKTLIKRKGRLEMKCFSENYSYEEV